MKIGLIQGDGIGPEIVASTQQVLEATGLPFSWEIIHLTHEDPEVLSFEAVKQAQEIKVIIKGPLMGRGQITCVHDDQSERHYPSMTNAIRRELKLFVNPRPVKGIKGLSGKYEHLDMVIMREITEDVYYGVEYMMSPDVAHCIKVISKEGARRIARYSFEYALANNRKKVTCVHKENILAVTDGLFLSEFRKVALEYPDIEANDLVVDAAAYIMAKSPEQLDVLCCPNQYGDILSDLAAGLVGSLGLAPGANIGNDVAMFEAVHGAAPDIANQGVANPAALILSGALMLRHLNYPQEAQAIETAIIKVMGEDKLLTQELGGTASTQAFTDAVCLKVQQLLV